MKPTALLFTICVLLALLGGCAGEQSPTEPTAESAAIPEIIMPNRVPVDLTGATVMEDGTVIVPARITDQGVTGERRYYTDGDVLYVTYYDQSGTAVMPEDPAAFQSEYRYTNLNYTVGREIEMALEKFLVETNLSVFREDYAYDGQLRLRRIQTCKLDEAGDPVYTIREFDENGNETKYSDCGSNWEATQWTQWVYNDRNQKIKQTVYNEAGEPTAWTEWTYHATRCVASQKNYLAGDILTDEILYDELGRLQEKREYTDGVLSKETLYQPDGSCEVRWYGPDGTVTGTENLPAASSES